MGQWGLEWSQPEGLGLRVLPAALGGGCKFPTLGLNNRQGPGRSLRRKENHTQASHSFFFF